MIDPRFTAEQGEKLDKAIRENERLRKENAELRARVEWKDMDSAPKDGTKIVVWERSVGRVVMLYMDGYFREPANMMRLRNEPTHWMPLPEPPNKAEG